LRRANLRLVSVLLTFVMIFGLLPVDVFADEPDGYKGYEPEYEQEYVPELEPEEEDEYEYEYEDEYEYDYEYDYEYEYEYEPEDEEYVPEVPEPVEPVLPLPTLPALPVEPVENYTPFSGAANYVYITFEGYNLGHGLYIEPRRVDLNRLAAPTVWDVSEYLSDCCFWLEWSFDWQGQQLNNVHGIGRGYVNLPRYLTDFEFGEFSVLPCCVPPVGGAVGTGIFVMPFGTNVHWEVTINHELGSRGGEDFLSSGEVIRWQASVTHQLPNMGMPAGSDLGIWSGWLPPLYEHADKSELIRAMFGYAATHSARQAALAVIGNPLATQNRVDTVTCWLWCGAEAESSGPAAISVAAPWADYTVRGGEYAITAVILDDNGIPLPDAEPIFTFFCGNADADTFVRDGVLHISRQQGLGTIFLEVSYGGWLYYIVEITVNASSSLEEAVQKLESHSFAAITQSWAGNSAATRAMAINAVSRQVEELLDGTNISFSSVESISFDYFDIGGVAADYFCFTVVGLAARGGDSFDVRISVNISVAHAPAVGINLTTYPDFNFVLVDSSLQFFAEVLPLGIPQGVRWEVSGHYGAAVDGFGLLTVRGVPNGTELIVTAAAEAEDIRGEPLTASLSVTVVDEIIEWSGAGTAGSPFLIGTKAQLELLAYRVNTSPLPSIGAGAGEAAFAGVHFRLTDDIELDYGWQPIGAPFIATSWVHPNRHHGASFEGIFDGAGHTVSFAHGSQPLFGAVWLTAEIRNLNIYGPYIAGHGLIAGVAAQMAFGMAGVHYPLVDNVRILSGTTIRGSGISGTDGFRPQQLRITNSVVEAGVRIGFSEYYGAPFDHNRAYFAHEAGAGPGVGSFVSGLAGYIDNSVSYATVYGHPNVRNVGGLVGYKQQSMRTFEITNSAFHGTIIAPDSVHVGGILGGGYDAPNPRNSTLNGQLGGIWAAPNSPGANISGSTVTGTIIGYDYVGGIIGGEFVNQMWSTGSTRGGAQHVVERNRFEGRVDARRRGTRRSGGVFGYVRSLNRNNVISDNVYLIGATPLYGLGQVSIVDTVYENPAEVYGTAYFDTRGWSPTVVAGHMLGVGGAVRANYYREDDPIGSHMYRLVRADASIIVEVDRASLRAAISDARRRTEVNYNPFNWPDKVDAYRHAAEVYSDTGASQAAVTAAANALLAALNSLQPRGLVRTVTVSVTDPNARAGQRGVFLPSVRKEINPGETAYSLLRRVGLNIVSTGAAPATMYVVSIDGWGEFSDGALSGWMYAVNGVFPSFSAGLFELNCGDDLRWLFTRDLGRDLNAPMAPCRDALDEQLARVLGLDEARYTRESWLAILEAQAFAQDVRDTPAAPQAVIDDAAERLRAAIDGRVAVRNIRQTLHRDTKELRMEVSEDANRVEAVLSVKLVHEILRYGLALTVHSDIAVITLDADTLTGLVYGMADDVRVVIIAERIEGSLFSFSVMVGEYAVTDFDGEVRVSVPYRSALRARYRYRLTVYHLADSGEATEMQDAVYYRGTMSFTTTHFSLFLISERSGEPETNRYGNGLLRFILDSKMRQIILLLQFYES